MPRRSRTAGLRAYLLRRSVAPLALVVALSTIASYVVARMYADEAFDAALFDTARALAQRVEAGAGDLRRLPNTRALLEFDPVDTVYYAITDAATGRVVSNDANIVLDPSVAAASDDRIDVVDGRVGGRRVRAVRVTVQDPAGQPIARIVYAETLRKRDRLGLRLFLAVFAPQLLIALAAAALITLGVRDATQPLERFAGELGRRSSRDLRPVADPGRIREIRQVAIEVNRLIRRLRRSATAQQAFIGNAAHQLRTPLAGIVAQVARLQGERDPERMGEGLAQLEKAAERATRLVNQMLTLARSAADGEGSIAMHPMDLAPTVRDVCAEWVPEALARRVDLGYVGPESGVPIEGEEALVREMLANLIDNALRYGARPGVVTVRLDASPLVLSVEDDGPGIPESERPLVFRRFYRIRDNVQSGSGLGLAIVREIAALHGASVAIRAGSEGKGTLVEVRFGGMTPSA